MATGNMYRTICEILTCGFRNLQVERQTDRQTDIQAFRSQYFTHLLEEKLQEDDNYPSCLWHNLKLCWQKCFCHRFYQNIGLLTAATQQTNSLTFNKTDSEWISFVKYSARKNVAIHKVIKQPLHVYVATLMFD